MQDLRLVTVSEDGSHIVLAGPDGEQFRVPNDDQLRAAVRRDRPRLGQLQIQMESHVRPREIQARIRAGETAEEVAASAGVPIEHVRRFEHPVLAEREYVARQARGVVPRRSEGRSSTLDALVAERLEGRGLDVDSLEWDAWRREDGTWTVRLTFPSGKATRLATWRFDPGRRTVVPEDDDAVWLTDGEQTVTAPVRRLSAVRPVTQGEQARERVYDLEADGGLERARAERDLTARPAAERAEAHDPVHADADRPAEPAATASHEPATVDPVHPAAGDPAEQTRTASPEPASDPTGEPADEQRAGDRADEQPDEQHAEVQPAEEEPARAAQAGGRRRAGRRASVPSWDDILLGTRRPD